MEVEIRDRERRPVGTATVDPATRPALVRASAADGTVREVLLDWERAIDDGGCLRACVACGCRSLYRRRSLPRFAPFALVLAAAGVVAGVLGYSSDPLVLAALVALVVLDAAVLVLARTQLVCYACGTTYSRARVARYVKAWDARTAAEVDGALAPAAGPPAGESRTPSLPSNP